MQKIGMLLVAVFSGLLAGSCCLAPLLFLLFGIGVGSLSFLEVLAPYRWIFVVLSLGVLGYLWLKHFTQNQKISCTSLTCKNYTSYLSFGTLLVFLFLTYPFWVTIFLE